MRLLLFFPLLLLVLLTPHVAHACGAARQSRILPVGVAGQEVVALHLRMDRGDAIKGGETDWEWYGTAIVTSFSMPGFKIKKRLLTKSFRWPEKAFEAELEKTYKLALETARTLCNIQLLQPQSITICDFAPTCDGVRLTYKPKSKKIMLEVGKYSFAVDVAPIAFTDSGSVVYYPLAGMEDAFRPDKIIPTNTESSEVDLYTMLQMGSVRKYQLNGKTLMLVHFGTGERYRYDDEGNLLPLEPEITPEYPTFNTIHNCSYNEPVMYHGTGVDIAFWVN